MDILSWNSRAAVLQMELCSPLDLPRVWPLKLSEFKAIL